MGIQINSKGIYLEDGTPKIEFDDICSESYINKKLITKADIDDVYTRDKVDEKLSVKADISNVYTKDEVDEKIDNIASIEPLNIYKTLQAGSNVTVKVDLGLEAGEYRAVFGSIYMSANGDLDDHFNVTIGKGASAVNTWGNKGYPIKAPTGYSSPVTHMGDNQGGGKLKIGHYGYWTEFIAWLNDDGTLTLDVRGNDTHPYIALKIIGGIK